MQKGQDVWWNMFAGSGRQTARHIPSPRLRAAAVRGRRGWREGAVARQRRLRSGENTHTFKHAYRHKQTQIYIYTHTHTSARRRQPRTANSPKAVCARSASSVRSEWKADACKFSHTNATGKPSAVRERCIAGVCADITGAAACADPPSGILPRVHIHGRRSWREMPTAVR